VNTVDKYNGWANRDTWLLTLWADNERKNYDYILRNKAKLLKMDKTSLLMALRLNMKIGDKVNWSKVNVSEVKRFIKEVE